MLPTDEDLQSKALQKQEMAIVVSFLLSKLDYIHFHYRGQIYPVNTGRIIYVEYTCIIHILSVLCSLGNLPFDLIGRMLMAILKHVTLFYFYSPRDCFNIYTCRFSSWFLKHCVGTLEELMTGFAKCYTANKKEETQNRKRG